MKENRSEYVKFNSNTGYCDDEHLYMQALSHFSYAYTNGRYVICDLQGGRYSNKFSDETRYVLTDPAVLSSNEEFGPTDLGQKGIDIFFMHHRCGRWCQPDWPRPATKPAVPHFRRVMGLLTVAARAAFARTPSFGGSPGNRENRQNLTMRFVSATLLQYHIPLCFPHSRICHKTNHKLYTNITFHNEIDVCDNCDNCTTAAKNWLQACGSDTVLRQLAMGSVTSCCATLYTNVEILPATGLGF